MCIFSNGTDLFEFQTHLFIHIHKVFVFTLIITFTMLLMVLSATQTKGGVKS